MNQGDGSYRRLALLVFAALCVFLSWQMLRPFVAVFLWSGALAILFHPVHRWILRKTRRPGLSAVLSVMLVVAVVVVPLFLVGSALAGEVAAMAGTAKDYFQDLLADPVKGGRLRDFWVDLQGRWQVQRFLESDAFKNLVARIGQVSLQGTLAFLGGLTGFVVNSFFMVFTLFYLFRDGDAIKELLPKVIPLEAAGAERLIGRTRDIVHASVFGVIVIAMVQGTLGGLMFLFLGLPSPLLWGVVMTVVSTLPLVGASIVWLPAAAFLALTGHWVKAVILVVWAVGVIGTADNFLRPVLVGKRAQMHDLLVFFSVLGGIQVFGMMGLVVGPVIIATTVAVLQSMSWEPGGATAQSPRAPDAGS